MFHRGEIVEIKLNRAYTSHWDNWEYPIHKLADGSYLCIAYSNNHGNYYLNRYTEEEFAEQGFEESEWEDWIFESIEPAQLYI